MRVYASRRMDAMNRLRAGMTQAELARAIGTTQSHVSEYESGARRMDEREEAVARAMGSRA